MTTPSDFDPPEHNTRNFIWIIVGLTVVAFGCFACCGGVLWLAAERLQDLPGFADFADAALPTPVVESAAEKQAWSKAAFADSPPDGGFERRSLDIFFQRVVDASQSDDAAFQRLVDGERFWRSVKERGLIKQLTRGEDREMGEIYRAELECPGVFQRFHVQAVTTGSGPDEAVAYVMLWEDDWISEYRWWLVRDGRLWKTYDWEPLQIGVRQSLRHAAYAAELGGISDYSNFWTAIQKSADLAGEGQEFEAAAELHKAGRLTVPPMFRAEQRLHTAYAWARLDRPVYENEIYQTADAQQIESAPGFLMAWAMEAYEQDDFETALELIDRFEQAIGGGPNVEQIRADSLFALGRTAEAAPHYERLLRYSPDDQSIAAKLARSLPADGMSTLVEHLRKRPSPAEAAYQLAAYVTEDADALRSLETLLAELTPEAPQVDVVRGLRLESEGRADDAAEAYLAGYRKGETPDDGSTTPSTTSNESGDAASEPATATATASENALAYFHELYWSLDRPLEAYDRSPDKQKTFEYLVYQAEDVGLSSERRTELIARHAELAPDDTYLITMQAEAATAAEQHAQAVELWSRLLEVSPDHSYYARSSLAAELISLDRLDEAVTLAKEHPEDVSLLTAVSEPLIDANRSAELLQLTELPRSEDFSGGNSVAFLKVKALTALKSFDEAEAVLKSLYEANEETWQRRNVCRVWLETSEEAKWPAIRFIDLVGRDALADLIVSCEQNAAHRLQDLVDDWQARNGDAKAILPAEVSIFWRKQRFQELVDRVDETVGVQALTSATSHEALKRYVLSLQKLGLFERMVTASQVEYDATGDASSMVVSQMATGNWIKAGQVAATMPSYLRDWLYFDDVAFKLLQTDAAAEFRQRFPRDGGSLANTVAIVLFEEPLTGSRDDQRAQLRSSLQQHDEKIVVEPLDTPDSELLLVRNGERGAWFVAWGSEPYARSAEIGAPDDAKLRDLFNAHQAWITFDWGGGRFADAENGWKDIAHVVGSVTSEDARLLWLSTGSGAYLCPLSASTINEMTREGFTSADLTDREPFYLYRPEAPEPPTQLPRTFQAFTEAFASKSAGDEFMVEAKISLSHGELKLEMPVERVINRDYTIDVVVRTGSLPESLRTFFPGDRLQLRGWSLTGWSYTKDGKTVRATDLLKGTKTEAETETES